MIIYSQEVLSHFQCGDCKGWWTVGDHKDVKLEWQMSCPHCGAQHFEYQVVEGAEKIAVGHIFDQRMVASINSALEIRDEVVSGLKAQLFDVQQALIKEGMRADALQARITTVEVDAARYRWLRDDAWGCDRIGVRDSPHVCIFLSAAQLPGVIELAEEALDSAIDTNMRPL